MSTLSRYLPYTINKAPLVSSFVIQENKKRGKTPFYMLYITLNGFEKKSYMLSLLLA
jgi:hypothetical protein